MASSRTHIRKLATKMLPEQTGRRRIVGRVYRLSKRVLKLDRPRGTLSYADWMKRCEPKTWIQTGKRYKLKPLISIVVPAFNTPDKYLLPLLESVQKQLYPNWQLCIADGSTDQQRAKAIETACRGDERIVYKQLPKNLGIVGNTNEAIQLAKGTFVGLLDHDDTLSPYALLEVIDALNRQPKTNFFYSDEDKLSDDGRERSMPFFKPDWSPTLLENVNYITHFSVVRRSVLEKIGGMRKGFDGSQDYDLILRVTDYTDKIVHIPKILYHWRLAEGSTAGLIENKTYVDQAGRQALRDHVKRKHVKAKVLDRPDLPTNYRLQYDVPKKTKTSIIIPFKDKVKLTQACVESILKHTASPDYEIILISNNSTEKATHAWLATLKKEKRIKLFHYNKPFNFSAVNNFGRSKATGDYLVLLNNDTVVINDGWLQELIGVAAQPWAGAVGPELFYPNDKIQHAGVVVGMVGAAGHVFRMLREDALTAFGRPYWARDYLAVTAACLAVSARKFDEVGGLDEKLIVAGNDVAFGIRLHEKGYRNVYWPFAQLYHYENVSVGSYKNAPPGDYDRSVGHYYKPYLKWGDPYFNPNLSLQMEQIAFREQYE